ncbi:MAG TPA: 23S rRNA (uracil(1939)-C(5))-methyltransferase RlmD [Vicinamibacteria bacterium]|nr:23S rRNA (uracil(1939)-C(5))-methyltransferase RlmD [Vicinamibacteria bacterium]
MRAPSADLEVGDTVELAIEKAVYRGRGLGRLAGRVVFVPRSYPGDRVRARVAEVHAGYAEAQLLEVVERAAARRPAPCPQGPGCPGCTYQEVTYPEQLRLKEAVLRESLARAGAGWDGPITVHGSPERGWRVRATLHIAAAERGPLRIGFRREGSHRILDFGGCQQLSEPMNGVVPQLREALGRRRGLAARLRAIDLLESPDGSQRVAALATTLRPAEAPQLAGIAGQVPGLTGFGVLCHPQRMQWLHGSPQVEARVAGLVLRAHVASFFQANRFLLEPLVATVTELVPAADGRILDLFSGVGLFSLPLAARHGGEVTAVEHGGTAAEDARENARRNRLEGIHVMAEDVATALAAVKAEPGERVVLDPPRTGAGPAVVDAVAARSPQAVVYVSCDPPTLGRDLARFAAAGYRPDAVHLFDLFPDTFHLEAVARLRR